MGPQPAVGDLRPTMAILVKRLQAFPFSTRLTAAMVALVWLTATAGYFGPTISLAAALVFTAAAVIIAGEMTAPPTRRNDAGRTQERGGAPGTSAAPGGEFGIPTHALATVASEIDRARENESANARRTD